MSGSNALFIHFSEHVLDIVSSQPGNIFSIRRVENNVFYFYFFKLVSVEKYYLTLVQKNNLNSCIFLRKLHELRKRFLNARVSKLL